MRDLPIAERVTPSPASARPPLSRSIAHNPERKGTAKAAKERKGREGTPRTRRKARRQSFASFASLRGLGCSIALDDSRRRSSTHAQGGVTPWVVQSQWEVALQFQAQSFGCGRRLPHVHPRHSFFRP